MSLSDERRKIIAEQHLGFAATIGLDGSPNLSPKGTFAVLKNDRLAFADIRSPATIRNLRKDPRIEANFVDPFTRQGVRCSGRAETIIRRNDPQFPTLARQLVGNWPTLLERVRNTAITAIDKAALLRSPAYDVGVTSGELRAHWTAPFRALQPGGDSAKTRGNCRIDEPDPARMAALIGAILAYVVACVS